MGSSTSQTHLEAFLPTLRLLTEKCRAEFRVVSDRPPHLPGVQCQWRRWSAETELDELRGFDVGIMPMPDDEWSRGKCAMKALLYMSVGVPAVCSPVGMNRTVIQHGFNGFLADSPEQWLACLEALTVDRELRSKVGEAGRRTVEAEYSMQRSAHRFGEVLLEACEREGGHTGRQEA
jgi:glycosyltransferase involved in cell wall biosynthesis